VNNGSDANAGDSSAPFKTIYKAVASVVIGDVIYVAPGYYAEGTGGTGEDYGTTGYKLKRSVHLKFWDIKGDLPGTNPGKVTVATENSANTAFNFDQTGTPTKSGLQFARSLTGSSDPLHLMELKNFEKRAINVDRSAGLVNQVGDEVSLSGVDFTDCAQAIFVKVSDVVLGFSFEVKDSVVHLPSTTAGFPNDMQAIQVEAESKGAISMLLEKVDIFPSDKNHQSSAITVSATGHNDSTSPRPPILINFQSCRIGRDPNAIAPKMVVGAGAEFAATVKGAGKLTIQNSAFENCNGDGILVVAKGGSIQGANFFRSTWEVDMQNSKFSNGGVFSTNGPILDGNFSGSGVHCMVLESGAIPRIYSLKSSMTGSARHGIYLESSGQMNFPMGYPNVKLVGTLMGENGGKAQTVGEVGNGLDCGLADDFINLEIANSLFRGNATSGVLVRSEGNFDLIPNPSTVLATNCIFTDNLGFTPPAKGAPWGSAFHLSTEDGSISPIKLEASLLTIVENHGSPYAIAFEDEMDPLSSDMFTIGSTIENCILRQNGSVGNDISFYPQPDPLNSLWTEIFLNTYSCDLNNDGASNSTLYNTNRNNFYSAPLLKAYTFQGFYAGLSFPDSSLGSPVLDKGRIPGVSGATGIDIRSNPRPIDFLGGGPLWDVGAFELSIGE
jgi:uncharacterized protein DUF1565